MTKASDTFCTISVHILQSEHSDDEIDRFTEAFEQLNLERVIYMAVRKALDKADSPICWACVIVEDQL